MSIAIVNYGLGNLRSVLNAFEAIGATAFVAGTPRDLDRARGIVVPGVGAFGDGMRYLREQGWVDALEDHVRREGRPFLGLCLGMQLLATSSTEHGVHRGLDWVPGLVTRLAPPDPGLRVPHIGWNEVRLIRPGALQEGLGAAPAFYFVHSYAFVPRDSAVVTGTCRHGAEFVAMLEADNIFATQFHPEKSQQAGLTVLRNFARRCA